MNQTKRKGERGKHYIDSNIPQCFHTVKVLPDEKNLKIDE